jgi:hypothetical protein
LTTRKLKSVNVALKAVIMNLSVRPLEPQDFEACWSFSSVRDKFSQEEARRLQAAWSYLLPRDEMFAAVVEDVSGGDGPRAASFGGNVFVTDECMSKLRSFPRPLQLTRILFEAGRPDSSILNQRQIGLYNAQGGLNMVCVHRGEPFIRGTKQHPRANWEELCVKNLDVFSRLSERLIWAFQECNRGFHIREMLGEVYGPFELQWAQSSGNWTVRSDYRDHYSSSVECLPSEQEHPYLVGATQEEQL